MSIDYGTRTMSVKLVIYGPELSGKTTVIKSLFSTMEHEDGLALIEESAGQEMFRDFGTIPFVMERNWTMVAHIWSTTCLDSYKSTRAVVLDGTDGIVFVADSQEHHLDTTLACWIELMSLIAEQIPPISIVVGFNKQDLPSAIDADRLRAHLQLPDSIPSSGCIALDGANIPLIFWWIVNKMNNDVILRDQN